MKTDALPWTQQQARESMNRNVISETDYMKDKRVLRRK
jgi:hypothetical protein